MKNKDQIEEMVKRLEEAEKVIGFYGSYESWCEWKFPKAGEDAFYSRVVESDVVSNVGGKRAREYQSKYMNKSGEV